MERQGVFKCIIMKRNIIYLVTVCFLVFVFVCYYNSRFELLDERPYVSNTDIIYKDNTNIIGVIGDSWVSHKKLDSLVGEYSNNALVASFGVSGAKSSDVYNSLTYIGATWMIYLKPEYCILTPSINDMASMLGPDYYAHHNILTVKLLLDNGITPVIVTMPEIDMEGCLDSLNPLARIRTEWMARLNGSYNLSNKDYTNELLKELKANGIYDKVVIFDFDKVTPKYDKKYYRDFAHLNETGKERFIGLLTMEIQ